ncbi:hypothetical protein V6N13_126676 [Hibiscus sabdariffa]
MLHQLFIFLDVCMFDVVEDGYKIENGQKLEPIEEVTIEVNDEHVGLVLEALSHRRAEVADMGPVAGNVGRTRLSLTCPSRVLVFISVFASIVNDAYEKYRGPLGNVEMSGKEYWYVCLILYCDLITTAFSVSMGYGTITAYALMSLEAGGTLFVTPGMEAYDGMIVGEHSRDTDLDVNPVRSKELSNMRAAGKDENVKLSPPRLGLICYICKDDNTSLELIVQMTLEEAIAYVASDELIEVRHSLIHHRFFPWTSLSCNKFQ